MRMLWLLFIFPCALLCSSDFERLMGENTPHWKYIGQSNDRRAIERAKALYAKNAPMEYAQSGSYKVPPVIHFIWLGPKPFPPQSVENVRSWIAQHPTWRMKFWTDREREVPCEGMERCFVRDFRFTKLQRCFDSSENFAEKSDVLRYEILFQEGGLYVDHDTHCLRSFDALHRGYDFFSGLEPPHEAFVGRNITCGNAVIAAAPGHPILHRAIDLVAERWDNLAQKFRGRDDYSRIEVVMQRTYIAFTDAVEACLDQSGHTDILFPAAYFFAKSGIPPIYSQHFYETSWDDTRERTSAFERSGEKALARLKRTNTLVQVGLLVLIGMNLLLFIKLIFRRKRS